MSCFPLLRQASASLPDAASPPVADAPSYRWALLVGVDDYAELSDLNHPSLAIRQLEVRLTAAGFPTTNVFVMSDRAPASKYLPSRANIERQLELITALPSDNDLLVVVLCGRVAHREGRSFFSPLDAHRANLERTSIDMQTLFDRIAGSAARHKLLVLDLAPVSDDEAGGVFDPLLERWQEPPSGMSVWFSCSQGQSSHVASSLDWTVFMHYLVSAWEGGADEQGNQDGLVSLGELADFVARETGRQTERAGHSPQAPVLRGEIPRDLPLGRVAQYTTALASYPTIEDDIGASTARLDAVSRIHPRSLRAYNQALAAYGQNDLIEAINLTTDALRYDRGNTWALILRALCYAAYGDLARAIEDYRELGIPLPCLVVADDAVLRDGETVIANLRQGDRVHAIKADGERLWVQVHRVEGVKSGWIVQNKLE